MSGHEYGKQMKYPYTITGKFLNFPWKFHWKHGRGVRFTAYSLLICYPIFYQLHKAGKLTSLMIQWCAGKQSILGEGFVTPECKSRFESVINVSTYLLKQILLLRIGSKQTKLNSSCRVSIVDCR